MASHSNQTNGPPLQRYNPEYRLSISSKKLRKTMSQIFEPDNVITDASGEVLCDRCGEQAATHACEECAVPFCAECVKEVHKRGKWITHTIVERGNEGRIGSASSSNLLQQQRKESTIMTEDRRQFLLSSVLNEIVTTEKEYLKYLTFLQQTYIGPIRAGRFPELTSGGKGDLMVVLSTIDLIADGNAQLLAELEVEMNSETPKIGSVFLAKLDNFKLYNVFCNHQEEAMDTLNRVRNRSAQFRTFLDSCKSEDSWNLGIMELIVKPFQRILKYSLLLKELLKYTPEDHPDRQSLKDAFEKMQVEVDAINKNKAGADNLKKMVEIYNSIVGQPKNFRLLENNRYFIRDGTMMKISKNKEQERHFFLFNDTLLYCAKSKIGNTYAFRGLIDLEKLLVEDLQDTDQVKNAFQLIRTNVKNKTYIVHTKTFKEKLAWLREFQLKKEERMSYNWILDAGDVDSKGPARPIWRHDLTTDSCQKCGHKFSLTYRKHHCRYCGRIFCSTCSNFSCDLPPEYEYSTPQRVCVDCFNKLTNCGITLQQSQDGTPASPKSEHKSRGKTLKIDPQNPLESYKEGYMVKKGHRRRNWKRRYFVLRQGVLTYYAEQPDALDSSAPLSPSPSSSSSSAVPKLLPSKGFKGSIDLKDYTLHVPDSNVSSYQYCVLLKGKKDFFIRADNQTEYNDWYQVIGLLAKKGEGPVSSDLLEESK